MSKRLLCYDTKNPIGVDENGVLDCSTLQPYYSKNVLFKTLTKDDFETLEAEGTEMSIYKFGSKLNWLTSSDDIHIEYVAEMDGRSIDSLEEGFVLEEQTMGSGIGVLLQDVIIVNGMDMMAMEEINDCMVIVQCPLESITQLQIKIYKKESNKLPIDLVDGAIKLKVYDLQHGTLEDFFTEKIINEIREYTSSEYLIGIKNIDHDDYDDESGVVLLHDLLINDPGSLIEFTMALGEGMIRYKVDVYNQFGGSGIVGGYTNTALYLKSSTSVSSPVFKITVNDSGNITATEV